MRIARFKLDTPGDPGPRLALVHDDTLLDLTVLAPDLPQDLPSLLAAGSRARERLEAVAGSRASERAGIAIAEAQLLAPLRPGKCLAIGLNYRDHAEEMGTPPPRHPIVFTKQVTAVQDPFGPVHLPRVSDQLDFEGELVCVIGRRCRHVPRDRAVDVIAGYCVGNDVSVRDWQMRTGQFTLGKSFDTHAPFGPWLVTADAVTDPHTLALSTRVNGELRQSSNTSQLIFDCFDLVTHLSQAFTLEPGDLIFTGTPSGVGAADNPPRYLHAGDRVRVEIEGIGAIDNPVIPEPDSTAFID
ncbi:MAG: fumarylacetoacetate hydrolase family protein [Gammaproteobacteria bacterium]|nr:fumarylacetoacetate hydrolase family protein [Gammaproteobacteria bacterium]